MRLGDGPPVVRRPPTDGRLSGIIARCLYEAAALAVIAFVAWVLLFALR